MNPTLSAMMSWLSACAALVVSLACAPGGVPVQEQSEGSVVGVKSQQPTSPDSQISRFLTLSTATRAQRRGMFDSLVTCRDREEDIEVRWIADFQIIAVRPLADTMEAKTRITSVARQREQTDGYVGYYRIAEDTATWRLVLDKGTWKVCGDSREGFNVMMLGSITRWEPATRSIRDSWAAIDSIRTARGKPIVR